MSYISTGASEGVQMCEALGLDPDLVQEIHLHVVPDEVITVDVTQIVTDEQAKKLKTIWKRWVLTEVKTEQPMQEKEDV